MQVAESTALDAAQRVAWLLAAELEQAVERREFGVIVRDISPLDLPTLTDAISKPGSARRDRLRVAVVGANDEIARAVARHPSLRELLCPDEETAVSWRNQRLRTIAVVTNRPLAKAASLRDFRVIDEHDIAARLCHEESEAAEVGWLRALWNSLERAQSGGSTRGRALRFSLADLVAFAGALAALPAADRSAHAPRHLHVLGLFPDGHLADEQIETRLQRRLLLNKNFVKQVQRATDEDWARIRAHLRTLSGSNKTIWGRVQRRLREIAKGGLAIGVDLAEAQALWSGKTRADSSSEPSAPRP